ncbi:hypothetical protein [Mycolicibacterium sp.]
MAEIRVFYDRDSREDRAAAAEIAAEITAKTGRQATIMREQQVGNG